MILHILLISATIGHEFSSPYIVFKSMGLSLNRPGCKDTNQVSGLEKSGIR